MNNKSKKSLGQNFLTSANIAREIAGFAELSSVDTVLEVGPGKGILTEYLLKSGASVIAVEKDNELYRLLEKRFGKEISSGRLSLINGDILEFDVASTSDSLSTIVDKKSDFDIVGVVKDYKLVANIPYNITGQIFRKFLTHLHQPSKMVVMVQREVGERIVANNGKESVLSLSVKVFGTPRIRKNVSKRHFLPQPRVDSVVLDIGDISRKHFEGVNEKVFFTVIKSGFSHKRKKLSRNLEEVFDRERVAKGFREVGLPENVRAEDVSLLKWLEITQYM